MWIVVPWYSRPVLCLGLIPCNGHYTVTNISRSLTSSETLSDSKTKPLGPLLPRAPVGLLPALRALSISSFSLNTGSLTLSRRLSRIWFPDFMLWHRVLMNLRDENLWEKPSWFWSPTIGPGTLAAERRTLLTLWMVLKLRGWPTWRAWPAAKFMADFKQMRSVAIRPPKPWR